MSSSKPVEIVSKLNERAGFSPDEEIELYEEIKFEPCVMCERLEKRTSFRSSQAKPYLQAGEFEIVDESIWGTYDEESMRKTAMIASRSVDRDVSSRPNIAEVAAELKEAYSIQLSYLATVEHST